MPSNPDATTDRSGNQAPIAVGMPPQRPQVSDALAAISVAVVVIPQSLAYATLAGMPPHYGLFAAGLPLIAAAFFASSPYLQTGPVALTAILTFGVLSELTEVSSGDYIALAALLALMVGVIRVGMGLVRLGFLSYLLSKPILKGFTSAAAILIIASQLPTLLGVEQVYRSGILSEALGSLASPGQWHWPTLAMGLGTVALTMYGRRLHHLFPGVLVAVLGAMAYSAATGYQGAAVGPLPSGLPPLSVGFPWQALPALLLPATVIAVVGFAEPAVIARHYAAIDRQLWDPNREFVSQGVANIASAVVSGFPVGGSFSRTGIARMSGAKTRWTGAMTGALVLAFLPWANLLATLPSTVLAGVVIAGVIKLVQARKMFRLFGVSRPQAGVAWVTFLATLALAPRIDHALLLGMGLGILVHLWRELHIRVETEYRDGTLYLRPIGVLFFGSAPDLDQALLRQLAAHPDASAMEIQLERLGRIDYTGAVALKDLAEEAANSGLAVTIVGPPPMAREMLRKVLPADLLG